MKGSTRPGAPLIAVFDEWERAISITSPVAAFGASLCWDLPSPGIYFFTSSIRGPQQAAFACWGGSNGTHFWQPRFYDFNVFSEEKQNEKTNYMHNNPVKRGLVSSPAEWRWSSYRAYALRERGPVNMDWLFQPLRVSQKLLPTHRKSR